ncbi:MAG: response regulator [Candidatus Woesearchaeota archaeon]
MKQSKLILVVDDEPDIREAVKDVLKDSGFEVQTANDGKDCLTKLKKCEPSLILLDVLMPGLTTREIVEKINKSHPLLPIILLTVVKLSEATKMKIFDGNISDYIEKPFDNQDLVKRIKKAMSK